MPNIQKNGSTNSLVFYNRAICIVFRTNQNQFCNGSFEGRSFRQACEVRNEDSRKENEEWLKELLGVLLPAISTVFKTNQNRSCNGNFESRSFRQACAVRNEDSRYENGDRVSAYACKRASSVRTRGTAPKLLVLFMPF